MITTRLNKNELLEIVMKNKKEHRSVFLEAQKRYREKAIQILDEQLTLARKGEPFVIQKFVQLAPPQDHTKDYDKVIKQLTLTTDQTIELSSRQFENLVQDNWDWGHSWAESVSNYGVSNSKVDQYLNS